MVPKEPWNQLVDKRVVQKVDKFRTFVDDVPTGLSAMSLLSFLAILQYLSML